MGEGVAETACRGSGGEAAQGKEKGGGVGSENGGGKDEVSVYFVCLFMLARALRPSENRFGCAGTAFSDGLKVCGAFYSAGGSSIASTVCFCVSRKAASLSASSGLPLASSDAANRAALAAPA